MQRAYSVRNHWVPRHLTGHLHLRPGPIVALPDMCPCWSCPSGCLAGLGEQRRPIPTTAVLKPSEKGRRQPYVQKQALIREEAVRGGAGIASETTAC